MSQIKIDFLNWQPDAEDLGTTGLVTADNVYHDTDGYQQVAVQTAGAFSTKPAFATSVAVSTRVVGSGDYHITFAVDQSVTATPTANASLYFEDTQYTTAALNTLASISSPSITHFDACELNGYIFMTAECQFEAQNGNFYAQNLTGYAPSS